MRKRVIAGLVPARPERRSGAINPRQSLYEPSRRNARENIAAEDKIERKEGLVIDIVMPVMKMLLKALVEFPFTELIETMKHAPGKTLFKSVPNDNQVACNQMLADAIDYVAREQLGAQEKLDRRNRLFHDFLLHPDRPTDLFLTVTFRFSCQP